MSSGFNKGDEVQHKSGGPKMVVEGDDEIGRVICSYWNEKAKKFVQDTFPPGVLKKYEPPTAQIMAI
jgi:uncharacterized protein YodC (DUF2158 family)